MFEDDWIMRQIAGMARFLAKMLFNKESPAYHFAEEHSSAASDDLHSRLLELLNENKINEAENLLFELCDLNDFSTLNAAIDFYDRLNAMDDGRLEAAGFSRGEVQSGFDEILTLFGVNYKP